MPLLKDLLAEIEQGRFAVPEIQRPYVWNNQQVRELFESIYNGYPIGSIIVWEPAPEIFDDYDDLFRAFSKELEDKRSNFKYMVIDGQQRLLSLWLVKKGKIRLVVMYGHERERSINLFYHVSNNEFFVGRVSKKYEKDPNVYRVSDILDYDKFVDIETLFEGKELGNDVQRREIRRNLSRVREAILNYSINIYSIPESSLRYHREGNDDNFLEIFEKITQMFVKLNYTGTRVRMPHLIVALMTGKTRREYTGASFRGEISKIISELDEAGWEISEGVLMRSFLVIATEEPGFKNAREILNKKLNASDIIRSLKNLDDTLKYVVRDVLNRELNIKKHDFLKSEYLIVPLTYYTNIKKRELNPTDIKGIERWIILASFNRRYTGRLESDLKEDIDLLKKNRDITSIIRNLQTTEMQEEWLDRPADAEHLTLLAILLKDSHDLIKGEIRRIREIDCDHIHVHHIFPKSQIEKYYDHYKEYYREQGLDESVNAEDLYDHVANITLISDNANESIGNKLPEKYLSEFDQEIIKSHMIPLEKELWKLENYPQFLEQRKQLIMERVNGIFKS